MLRKNLLSGGDHLSGSTWARPCDTCAASPCRVYCRADAAYLCSACDARVHAANQVASRHERVSVCESCERAPAAFLCKADAASLCATCDADVHSANPLARRHLRIPIQPLSGPSSAAQGSKSGATLPMEMARLEDEFVEEDEDEAASWLLLNPSTNTNTNTNKGYKNNNVDTATNGCFLGAEVDEYLDLVEFNSGEGEDNGHLSEHIHTHYHYHAQPSDHELSHYDTVVPNDHDHRGFKMGVDFDINSEYAYNSPSISHSVSVSSSLEVPESTASDISTTHNQPLQQMPMQLSPMDREARVLRYREKKKMRKFEKTIRYASRKAYAEKRPRIKGRFAKRMDGEVQVDRRFTNPIMADGGYGIVPSF